MAMQKRDQELMAEMIASGIKAAFEAEKAKGQGGTPPGRVEPIRTPTGATTGKLPHPSNNVEVIKLDDGRLAIAFHPIPDEDYGCTQRDDGSTGNQRVAASGGGQFGTMLDQFAFTDEAARECQGLRFNMWISRNMGGTRQRTRRFYNDNQ